MAETKIAKFWWAVIDDEVHALKTWPEKGGIGAVVGKVWPATGLSKGSFWFDCCAWGGKGRQSAQGYAETLERAKEIVELVAVPMSARSEAAQ